MRITDLEVVPIAFRDPPLLNSSGVHEPLALRCVLRLHTEDGVVGLSEGPGDRASLDRLAAVRESVRGMSVFATTLIARAVDAALPGAREVDRAAAFSLIEVACLDVQGKVLGLPVSELLGGRVRDAVPYAAYLFYKWAGHPGEADDEWGEALDPDGIVRQARRMIDAYGFGSIKLKGGVFPPEQEIAAIRALRAAFPEHPLRIDPNCAWTPETGRRVAEELDGVLEYLEDPSPGVDGMAAVARAAGMPLASNMCVHSFGTLAPAVARGAVHVVLSDHHYWGGLRRTQHLATLCEAFGLGLSMHSNSHLGISLAAMTHLAASIPHLGYACDTHYPWNAADDVVVPGALRFEDGAVPVPTGPGLGVELDEAALARLHRAYTESGRQVRDDTGYMRRFRPDFDPALPRW
ncbi:glucarate dehydratase [Thermocatellispora tengchongensis]|uniref:glucarate dehydratase n=1 Tax=Thermocatellispora tengchongensis TaxID=1073253 RepID=A0A840P0R9_9ACTN|nr:enolase C-terminal domain-like protein [Thermocatellispora tengchongensis]MBB5131491.1 glucarate dehydratase [Thermocatellispora tengchongensis]